MSSDNLSKIKMVALYGSEKYRHILVAPYYYNKAGIYYEQETIQILDINSDEINLGEKVINCFETFQFKEKNLRENKESDWPAFKASKSKSLRSFQEDYYYFSITGLTPDNNTLRIEASPYKGSDIRLSALVSKANHSEIGSLIKKMLNMCKTGEIR
jgi:hypothetical protein